MLLITRECHNCGGVWPPCVERPWLFHWLINSVTACWILKKRRSSFNESRSSCSSMKLKMLMNCLQTTLLSSAHSLSIRWLWTETRVITLFNPLLSSIKCATSIFSMLRSHLTLAGKPKFSTSYTNKDNTLDALLLDKHRRYMIVWLKPSTQPCMTRFIYLLINWSCQVFNCELTIIGWGTLSRLFFITVFYFFRVRISVMGL